MVAALSLGRTDPEEADRCIEVPLPEGGDSDDVNDVDAVGIAGREEEGKGEGEGLERGKEVGARADEVSISVDWLETLE